MAKQSTLKVRCCKGCLLRRCPDSHSLRQGDTLAHVPGPGAESGNKALSRFAAAKDAFSGVAGSLIAYGKWTRLRMSPAQARRADRADAGNMLATIGMAKQSTLKVRCCKGCLLRRCPDSHSLPGADAGDMRQRVPFEQAAAAVIAHSYGGRSRLS